MDFSLRYLLTSLLLGFVAAIQPALAQDDATPNAGFVTESEGIRVFEPAYYNEFDPRSALELVFRTPGFQPQENSGGRGLSGVRSNILINGERPPPKGQSIRQQLREMPVASVSRIELIDQGARLDIDMQGYPQVVNVVTFQNRPAYYEFETQVQRQGRGDIDQQNSRNADFQGTGTFSWRGHEFRLGADMSDRSNRSPSSFVSIDPANPEQRISSLRSWEELNHGLDFNGIFQLPSESSLTLNARVRGNENESRPVPLAVSGPPVDLVDQSSDSENDQHDFSAEYRRQLGETGSILVALVDAQSEDQSSSSLTESGIVRSSLNDRENGETAARVLITQTPTENLTVRTTATTAFNYFEGDFQLFENGVELPIAGSDSRVEEDRHSVEGAVDWNFTEQWLFVGAAGLESYDIETRDASSGVQTDPKGQVSITYRPRERTTITLESQRRIGQLSFSQFLASSNLSSEILTAGATELEPVRRWNHSLSYDRRFGDRGVLRLSLSREKIDNPIRTVALTDSLTVSQNTSPRLIDGLSLGLQLPFARFGREDLILGIEGRINASDTIDPVTFERRNVSGLTKNYWSVEMRRDPGDSRLAWNFWVAHQNNGDSYSVRSISSWGMTRQWGAGVTWEVVDGLRLSANMDGTHRDFSNLLLFPAVRQPGLDPSFVASSTTWSDRFASLSADWRRMDHFEITASLSLRPKSRTEEILRAFGDPMGTLLATEFARTPRAQIRFRYYR